MQTSAEAYKLMSRGGTPSYCTFYADSLTTAACEGTEGEGSSQEEFSGSDRVTLTVGWLRHLKSE